jgi:hypothetical protein
LHFVSPATGDEVSDKVSDQGTAQDYTGGTAVIDGSNVALMHVSGGTKKFFRLHKP